MTAMDLSDAHMDAMRRQGDPAADECVRQLISDHGVAAVSAVFAERFTTGDPIPAGAPEVFRAFCEANTEPPPGTDVARIRRGQAVFLTNTFPALLVLLVKSLISGYAAPNLSVILNLSGNLSKRPYRRLLGVLQMVVDVCSPGGFEAGSPEVVTAQKLRLLHAGIRDIVRQHLPWYEEKYGVPVNQEDMIATILGFSYLVIVGLRQLGAGLTRGEEEDYYYAWRTFALLMGLRPEYMPETVDDAAAFYDRYAARHYVVAAANPDGVALAAADTRMIRLMLPFLLRALGWGVAPKIYAWDLVGPQGCALVGIERARGHHVIRWCLQRLPRLWIRQWHAVDHDGRLHEAISRTFLETLIRHDYRGGVSFMLPDRLKDLRRLG
jgi:hypothetical protein